jgi:hypothetical protein
LSEKGGKQISSKTDRKKVFELQNDGIYITVLKVLRNFLGSTFELPVK